jgi:hypothetical protein
MRAGIAAMASAVNGFASRCPNTQLVIVGYSQGGQVADNAFCGGPDANQGYSTTAPAFSAAAMSQIKAVIEMGNPRYRSGVAYQVGTCKTQGFSPRPQGYTCSVRNLSRNLFAFLLFCKATAAFLKNPKLTRVTVRQQNPKLLRQPRPLLLHRQRRQRAPGLRLGLRTSRAHFHQEQAQQQLRRRRQHHDYHQLGQRSYVFSAIGW